MVLKILAEGQIRGINIIGTIAMGISSLENILKDIERTEITSKEAKKMINNGITVLGLENLDKLYGKEFQKKMEELEKARLEYFKRNNITKILGREWTSNGEIRIWKKEEIENPPKDLPIPIVMSYDERVKEIGKATLFELAQERAVLIISTMGTTYEVKLTKNNLPREYFLVKGLRALLIYREGNEIISEELEIIPSPVGERQT